MTTHPCRPWSPGIWESPGIRRGDTTSRAPSVPRRLWGQTRGFFPLFQAQTGQEEAAAGPGWPRGDPGVAAHPLSPPSEAQRDRPQRRPHLLHHHLRRGHRAAPGPRRSPPVPGRVPNPVGTPPALPGKGDRPQPPARGAPSGQATSLTALSPPNFCPLQGAHDGLCQRDSSRGLSFSGIRVPGRILPLIPWEFLGNP